MKRLRLNPDTIAVTTFQAGQAPAGQGTVQGHLATPTCPSTRLADTCGCSADYATCYACDTEDACARVR